MGHAVRGTDDKIIEGKARVQAERVLRFFPETFPDGFKSAVGLVFQEGRVYFKGDLAFFPGEFF